MTGNLTRTLVAAIAVAAIAAPAAQAEPTYTHDTPGKVSAHVQRTQDLRSPDTRDVAEPRSDLTIGTRDATAVDSQSTRGPAQPLTPAALDDAPGTNWPAIGAGLGVAVVAISGFAVGRRSRRHRVAV